jgi:S1-C subfamily serine protease
LLALLETLVAVLVVDLAGFGVGEGFVGFGDEDELVVGGWVVAVYTPCQG